MASQPTSVWHSSKSQPSQWTGPLGLARRAHHSAPLRLAYATAAADEFVPPGRHFDILRSRVIQEAVDHAAPRHRLPPPDNTVTTNALSTRSRSSMIPDAMGALGAEGKDGQVARKVEGPVVRLDRGSSNLPGRTKGRARASLFFACRRGLRLGVDAVTTP